MEMSRVFDVSARSFDAHIRPLVPADAIRGAGKDLRFYGASVVAVWAVRHFGSDTATNAGDSDPLLVGPQSPALERYREARAEREDGRA